MRRRPARSSPYSPWRLVATTVSVHRTTAQAADSPYLVGRGISDVTGPAAENGMMGYSKFGQNTTGIHQRLRARAFVDGRPGERSARRLRERRSRDDLPGPA